MRSYSHRKNRLRNRFSIAASLLLMLTIPLAVWTLATGTNFDTRNFAANLQEQFSDGVSCTYKFNFVNSGTLEQDKIFQLELNAQVRDGFLNSVKVEDVTKEKATILLNKTYNDVEIKSVTEYFSYKAIDTGDKMFAASIRHGDPFVETPCVFEPNLQASNISVRTTNLAPEFTTDPYTQSEPSTNLKVGERYNYTLKAKDSEKDRIFYESSFTPEARWLNTEVESNGVNGELSLKYQGITDVAASFLANVFVHDGYNGHLRSQSWVINVSPKANDNPIIKFTSSIKDQEYKRGSVITVSWEATDQNLINNFKIFYASNPGDQASWRLIDGNIAYKVNQYSIDTTPIPEGSYSIIVQAEDNQSPVGVGTAVDGPFTLVPLNPPTLPADPSEIPEDTTPDDGDVFQDPQIIDIEPSNRSEIADLRKSIKATLVPGQNGEVLKDTITFVLDGEDLTDKLTISDKSSGHVNIIYVPERDYEPGEHAIEISFTDSKEKEALKDSTFTVIEEDKADKINIFGFSIDQRTAIIVGVGLLIVILALVVPWLLYLAWKNSDDDDETLESPYDIPPQKPSQVNLDQKSVYTPTYQGQKKESPNLAASNASHTDNITQSANISAAAPVDVNKTPERKVLPTENFNTGLDPYVKTEPDSYNLPAVDPTKDSQPEATSKQTVEGSVVSTMPSLPDDALNQDTINNTQPVNTADAPEYDKMEMNSLANLAQSLEAEKENNPYNFLGQNQPESSSTDSAKEPSANTSKSVTSSISSQTDPGSKTSV